MRRRGDGSRGSTMLSFPWQAARQGLPQRMARSRRRARSPRVSRPSICAAVSSNSAVERFVRQADAAVGIEHDERFANGLHDRQRVVARLHEIVVTLDGVDIDGDERRAVDAVVGGEIRPHAQHPPPALSVRDLTLAGLPGADDGLNRGADVVNVEEELDVVDRPPDVGRQQVEGPVRRGRESPDRRDRGRRSPSARRHCR